MKKIILAMLCVITFLFLGCNQKNVDTIEESIDAISTEVSEVEAVETTDEVESKVVESVEYTDSSLEDDSTLSNEAIKIYRNIIDNFLNNKQGIGIPYEVAFYNDMLDKENFFFSLVDINSDGIEELLLQYDNYQANVFFAEDNGEFSDIEVNYYDSANNICYYDNGVDLSTIEVFKVNGKKKEILEEYTSDTIDDFETFVYYRTDMLGVTTEISEDEFLKLENKVFNEDSYTKYVLNKENIDKYLPLVE